MESYQGLWDRVKGGKVRQMKTKNKIDLNKLSFEELQNKVKDLEQQKKDIIIKKIGIWEIGQKYVIRTVTMIQIGRLIDITNNELIMEEASWIPDTGRWMNFLKNGEIEECEPFPDNIIIGRGSIIDATIWKHSLPREQK